jgi:RNA polymerase sigma-70 factor (ECF subfamily)
MSTVYKFPFPANGHRRPPPHQPSNEALIAAIAAGDKRAMELLFTRHNVRTYRFITRITGNPALSEEIVSEVFLEVWRGAGGFKGRSDVSTWILAIARHKAISALRHETDAQLDHDIAAMIVDDADDPETRAHQMSCGAVIRKCLMQLPPALQELVDLVYYQEKTVAEVAQIVGIPPGTVKTRMLRVRGRMEELLLRAGIRGAEAK